MARIITSLCFVFAAGIEFQLGGQTQPGPISPREFDVVSIKLNSSDAKGGGMSFRPGRLDATNVTLKQLIAQVYGIHAEGVRDLGNRIVGGPAWASTERYNVAARAEQPA